MVLVAMAMVYPPLDCSYCKSNARLKARTRTAELTLGAERD